MILSDDEDVIPETPPQKERSVSSKKRKVQVLSSDSEEEKDKKPKSNKQNKQHSSPKKKLKPLNNLEDAFGSAPVKQKKVDSVKPKSEKQETKTELGIHDDPAFEKTLLDLDDEIFEQNADLLDKTVEEALARKNESSTKKDSTEGMLQLFFGYFLLFL